MTLVSNVKPTSDVKNGRQKINVQSPGRINIIGEHTDYNDGFVLPAAIDKKMIMRLAKNGTVNTVQVSALDIDESYTFNLDDFSPLESGWQNYIMGVVHEVQQLGATFGGFDAEFEGNVPIGGGMSSSAALECSLAYALNELFDLGLTKAQMIKASQMAEHNFVGIKCGIMDQFASMMGKKNQVMMLDCRSLDYHYFPLDLGEYRLLLLNTNVSHSLASSEYNTRRSECEEGVEILKRRYPEIVKLRDVSMEQLLENKNLLSHSVYRRCHHVVSENQRVIEATEVMKNGDHKALGQLIYQSHFSLQNDYEVSCKELDFLVQQTMNKDYVLGSRMMGGGFGGCTINIIHMDHIETFVEEVSADYKETFGVDLTPYFVSIEDGTSEV
jgi:galactokinase